MSEKEQIRVKLNLDSSEEPSSDDSSIINAHLIDFGKPWYQVPSLLKLNFFILILTLPSSSSGYDGSLLNGLQSLSDWMDFMGNPSGARLGLLTAGVFFGNIIATIRIADIIADKYGRRIAIVIGQSFLIIGAVIQGSSKNFGQFFVSRIIVGFSSIACISAPVLISELAYPSHRSVATAYYNTTWYVGSIIASGITYGTYLHLTGHKSWRIPTYLQCALAVINIPLMYFIPESPRFLVNKGRSDEAREILIKYHANGDEALGSDLVDFELQEIQTAIELEKKAKDTSFSTFFRTKKNVRRFFICAFVGFMMNFSGNGLVSYYLTKVLDSIGITKPKRQLQINIWLMFFNYGVSVISALLVHKLKRRFTFLFSNLLMLTSYIIWTILSAITQKQDFENGALGKGVLAMIFIFYLGYNFALNVLPAVYATEILPFNLRSKGYTLLMLVCSAGNTFNAFVNPIAMDAIQWKYYIVYCCLLAFNTVVVYFLFVETHGYSLEEVSKVVFRDYTSDDIEYGKKAVAEHSANKN